MTKWLTDSSSLYVSARLPICMRLIHSLYAQGECSTSLTLTPTAFGFLSLPEHRAWKKGLEYPWTDEGNGEHTHKPACRGVSMFVCG